VGNSLAHRLRDLAVLGTLLSMTVWHGGAVGYTDGGQTSCPSMKVGKSTSHVGCFSQSCLADDLAEVGPPDAFQELPRAGLLNHLFGISWARFEIPPGRVAMKREFKERHHSPYRGSTRNAGPHGVMSRSPAQGICRGRSKVVLRECFKVPPLLNRSFSRGFGESLRRRRRVSPSSCA
jgi:hypothetical protein